MSPSSEEELSLSHPEEGADFFGTPPTRQQISRHNSPIPEAIFTPTAAGLCPQQPSETVHPPNMGAIITEAIRQGIAAGLQHRASSQVSDRLRSLGLREAKDPQGLLPHPDHLPSVSPSQASLSGEEEARRDSDLSEDEGLTLDQPAFMGLFRPSLFRYLLFKAKKVANMGTSQPRQETWQTHIRRTSSLRRTEALFVSFQPAIIDNKGTPSALGRRIRACIATNYETQSLPLPRHITAHSTRSAATTAAWATQASIEEVCRAGTSASLLPFIRHYNLDN